MKQLVKSKTQLPTEHEEQVRLCCWLKKHHPSLRFFAVPNGTFTNIRAATKAKREGLSKGVPDVFVPALRLFIEMKRQKGGTVSKEQKEWMSYLESVGYKCVVARGFKEASLAIIEHLDSL